MPEYDDETIALLALSLCPRVSNATVFALVERFGSATEVLAARTREISQVDGIRSDAVRGIASRPGPDEVERELELTDRFHCRLVPFFSDNYPRSLRHLDREAPVLLRVRGNLVAADRLAIAVVGSRRCSVYGRGQAGRFASGLAGMGFTVVSGLADGIDEAAHRGALAGRGRTIAVLGCGVARIGGSAQAELALQVAESGAVITELPMETPSRPGNFPPRNRLISGLSLGVVVVEAATRSGSLITARLAGEQGRMVFAVPGNVDSPTSHGCHQLIRDGAVLVESARDVVEGLGPLSAPLDLQDEDGSDAPAQTVEDARVMALNERERGVFEMLDPSARHIDEIITETGLPPSIVSSTLLTLEIRGLARQLPGQRYARN